jgi:hypothetical protein
MGSFGLPLVYEVTPVVSAVELVNCAFALESKAKANTKSRILFIRVVVPKKGFLRSGNQPFKCI